MTVSQKELDNIIRWDGRQRGWYEVYYLKFNDEASQTAYWLRYTMTSPLPRIREPYCELWGIFFDVQNPEKNFAVKNRFPIDRLAFQKDRFEIAVADSLLSQNSCRGHIVDEVKSLRLSWEFSFDSQTPAMRQFPWTWMYTAAVPKTKILSPHEFAVFNGVIKANDREVRIENAPGQQTHLYGTGHARRWAWGHCNTFAEDKDAIWEGLDSQIKLGPLPSPHLKIFYLKAFDREYFFRSPADIFFSRSHWQLGRWTFQLRNKEVHARGEIFCRPEEMVGVTYMDPDGQFLWCNNSKVASLKISLLAPDGSTIGSLSSGHGCAAEFVDRKIYEEVPIRI